MGYTCWPYARPAAASCVVTGWSVQDLIWWGLLLFVVPTVAFAAGSALLVHGKNIDIKGVTADAPNLAFKTCETYLWNLADAVPVLKIPQTMAWTPQLKFTDSTGRAFVLVDNVLLVLPFAQLAAIALARSFGDDRDVDPDQIRSRPRRRSMWRATTKTTMQRARPHRRLCAGDEATQSSRAELPGNSS